MEDESDKHHRRSIRLKGYDYRQAGAYFVTVGTRNRASLFGKVANGEIQLNDAGRIVHATWKELPARFPNLEIDEFIVMPNHIHGIIIVGAQFIAPSSAPRQSTDVTPRGAINRAPTLGQIVRAYKAVSTRMVRRTVQSEFAWQRNYYEHIIRDDDSLNHIRQYIQDNPSRWEFDRENPAAINPEPKNVWRAHETQAADAININLLRR